MQPLHGEPATGTSNDTRCLFHQYLLGRAEEFMVGLVSTGEARHDIT